MNARQITNLFKNITFNPVVNNNISNILLNPPQINGNNETKPSLINNNTQINSIDKNSFINIPFINNDDKNTINNSNQNIFLENLVNNNFKNNLYSCNNMSKINNNNHIYNSSNYPSFINNNNNLSNINNTNNNYSNLFNLNESNDENDIFNDNFPKFKTILMRKRGRPRCRRIDNEKPVRIHSSASQDNIQTKIQVHYFNFIISLVNEIVDVFLPNDITLRFLKLAYRVKKNVRNSYFQNLKNKKIGEILCYERSPSYLKYDRNYNKKTYEKLYKINNFIKNIFNMNYLEFFKRYYMNKNIKIWIYGKEVTFTKAKFFSDLLKAYPHLANKMEEIVKIAYNVNNGTFFKVDKNDDI